MYDLFDIDTCDTNNDCVSYWSLLLSCKSANKLQHAAPHTMPLKIALKQQGYIQTTSVYVI